MKPLRWVRSTSNKVVAGVCAGIATELQMATWVIRLLWVLFALFSAGLGILVYICCVIAFPRDDRQEEARQKMVAGVCSRIDARGDIELGLARLLALLLLLGSGGAALIGYIILHFVLDPAKS